MRTNPYTQIKAIPTLHNGVQYRSRLESRWAEFMIHIGMPFVYEPEQFDLGACRYTPDFRISKHIYFEIKPDVLQAKAIEKAAALAVTQKVVVYICTGSFYEDFTMIMFAPNGNIYTGYNIYFCENCEVIRIADSDTCPVCHHALYNFEKEKLYAKRYQFN